MMPPYDSSYRMKPPLRSAADVEAVRAGIVAGAIEAIASDHAPHPGSEKMQEFEKCPFGIIGLETALAIVLETLVHTKRIGLARLVELFTTGPARLLGLSRGRLSAGAPADVTISIRSAHGLTTSISRILRAGTRLLTGAPSAVAPWPPSSTADLSGGPTGRSPASGPPLPEELACQAPRSDSPAGSRPAVGARTISSWVISYHWWTEMGQVSTWVAMILYGTLPTVAVALLAFLVLWTRTRAE